MISCPLSIALWSYGNIEILWIIRITLCNMCTCECIYIESSLLSSCTSVDAGVSIPLPTPNNGLQTILFMQNNIAMEFDYNTAHVFPTSVNT